MKKRGRKWGKIFGSIATVVAFGACDIGGCGGCVSPLPNGVTLPADQTVEGGAQIRITSSGFQTLTDIIPDAINDALGDGFCIGEDGFAFIDVCHRNDCTGGATGCQVDFNTDFIDLSVPNPGTLRVNAQFDVGTTIFAEADLGIFGSPDCDIIVTANNTRFDANIGVGIDAGTGELEIQLQNINNVNFNPNIDASDCGAIIDAFGSLVSEVLGILDDFLNSFLGDLITPLLNDLIQGLLPDPLGLEGMLDGSSLIPGVSQETNASMELKFVPGGYAFLEGGGMSLGIISGLNADEDQSTRTADLDSEPALCVPPIPEPDFAAAPASLPTSPRGNFALQAANTFRGSPDPAGADLIIGASETMLDQLGHHLVTSGGMCLGVGPELSEQLNVGTLGLIVPSLAELGSDDGTDPLLLVTRPQAAIDFTIGEGTPTDPSLTLHLDGFEIDFYAFLFERYTRAFTLALTVNAGINLEFTTDANGDPAIVPTLVGLDAASIGLEVVNADFLREDPADLEAVLPTLLDALLPQLTGAIGPIALPDFAGFTLSNLSVNKVTTSEDDFIALTAELGTVSPLLAQFLQRHAPSALARLDQRAPIQEFRPSKAPAKVLAVNVPEPTIVRDALLGVEGGEMPSVSLSLATRDAQGRPLEWSYNLGGIWRPFSSESPLVIRDRAFAIQGRYTINLHSRVVGDYTTTSLEPISIPVVIDSAPPRIHSHRATTDGSTITVPVNDLVSARDDVMVAFGTPGETGPATGWSPRGQLSASIAENLSRRGTITVYAKDERGNVGSEDLDLEVLGFHGTGDDEGGCNCSSTQSASSLAGMLVVFGLAMLIGFRRRIRVQLMSSTTGIALVAAVIAVAAGACNCGDGAGPPLCTEDEELVCIDEAMEDCVCVDALRMGRIGQYSELAIAPDGSYWVSAYNSTHGDLMVVNTFEQGRIPDDAWEFIDGVPDGPVAIPDSDVRGGIREPGPDVGLYTDIAVSGAGNVVVSYFDNDTGSLKVAVNSAGAWTTHVVDDGVGGTTETGFEVAGQYSSVALNSAGNPTVAYFVHLAEASERRTEVRVATAVGPNPTSAGDWTIEVVEAAPVAGDGSDNILTIPEGNGLFINLTMRADDTPALAYYDRINGDLKLAESDGANWTITVLDGVDSDVGWYPGVAYDSEGVAHVSYVSSSNDDLLYINTADMTQETVDDGYRIVGQTPDGLPKPEFHFVGDDSTMVLSGVGPLVVYQDATTHELLLAQKNGDGNWVFEPIAGNEDPWVGGYGFYASGALQGENIVMSTWAIDQQTNSVWVEIFSQQIAVQ